MRTITFQELRVFREIVRTGGITAAADNLGMAKSAVSKQLMQLEEHLQVQLLARSSRRVTLTREGEMLLPRIESLIAEGDRLVEDAHQEIVNPVGAVRIAASPEFGAFVAKQFLPAVLEKYPDLNITMKLGYSFEDLQDPSFDLAFRLGHVHDDRLVAKPLGEFRRIVISSPDYANRHDIQQPSDLETLNCLIFSGNSATSSWTLYHKQDRQRVETVNVKGNIAVQGFSALMGVVENGIGVANVPGFITTSAIQQGAIIHCLQEWASGPMPVFLAYRFGAEKIGRIKAVIDEARNLVPKLLAKSG